MTSDELGDGDDVDPGSTIRPSPPCNLSNCITLNTKPLFFHKDESIAYLNPSPLLKVYDLNLEISSQNGAYYTLKCSVCCHNLANLGNCDPSRITLRKLSELLGSCWEPTPYIMTALKSPLKIAIHLSYKMKHILIDHRKLLLSLVSCGKTPDSKGKSTSKGKWYSRQKNHPIYAKLINLKPASIDQHLVEIKKTSATSGVG